jgi:hypothetical protein
MTMKRKSPVDSPHDAIAGAESWDLPDAINPSIEAKLAAMSGEKFLP